MYVNENVKKENIRSKFNRSVLTISLRSHCYLPYTTKSEFNKIGYALALIWYQIGSI